MFHRLPSSRHDLVVVPRATKFVVTPAIGPPTALRVLAGREGLHLDRWLGQVAFFADAAFITPSYHHFVVISLTAKVVVTPATGLPATPRVLPRRRSFIFGVDRAGFAFFGDVVFNRLLLKQSVDLLCSLSHDQTSSQAVPLWTPVHLAQPALAPSLLCWSQLGLPSPCPRVPGSVEIGQRLLVVRLARVVCHGHVSLRRRHRGGGVHRRVFAVIRRSANGRKNPQGPAGCQLICC